MVYQLNIAQPCHEDWDAMIPGQDGKHCMQCCKTVVDFTDWTTDEIAAYLQARDYKGVCGRFRETQLSDDYMAPDVYVQHVQRSGLSYLKRIAALIVFALFLSVSNEAQAQEQRLLGEPALVTQKPAQTKKVTPPQKNDHKPPKKDTVRQYPEPMIMGRIAPLPKPKFTDTTNRRTK